MHNTSSDLPLPQTIDDAVDPAWAGQLGVAPTNGSFLAFVSAMILERGEDATREWLEALAANDPVEFDGNAPIVDATDTGELAGAWSTITTCCVCGRRVRAGTPRTTHPGRGRRLVGDAGRSRGHGRHPESRSCPAVRRFPARRERRRPISGPRHSSFR